MMHRDAGRCGKQQHGAAPIYTQCNMETGGGISAEPHTKLVQDCKTLLIMRQEGFVDGFPGASCVVWRHLSTISESCDSGQVPPRRLE